MAKLTPEQKALNKEAVKLRDRAYTQRRNAYRAEIEAALKIIDDGALAQATAAADSACNAAQAARDAACEVLEAQIAALKQKLEETQQAHRAVLHGLHATRNAAWDARRHARSAAEAEIAAKYPDVADCWSAAGWKPFEEFLPQVTAQPSHEAGEKK